MDFLLATITAIAVSLTVIPVMVRLAPTLGMLDRPDSRKVHRRPIPRVGGWGIVCGTVVGLAIWIPLAPISQVFVAGAAALLLIGALDDSRDLPALLKLALQAAVVLPAVLYADLAATWLPQAFGSNFRIPYAIAVAFGCLGLLTAINAANTSDGLDGLAAGETLLSLVGIIYFAYTVDSSEVLAVAAVTAGGLFGFLRYNTHPATIFMGDAGSQFLGFAVGLLGLVLLQAGSSQLSVWTILLLAGLPMIDLAVVALRRLLRGVSCFRADRTHLHHRLLDLGLSHTESVLVIYSLQACFVLAAVVTRGDSVLEQALTYLAGIAVVYGALHLAERVPQLRRLILAARRIYRTRADQRFRLLVWAPRIVMEPLVGFVLVACAMSATAIPTNFGVLAAFLLPPLAAPILLKVKSRPFITRVPTYLVAAATLFLYTGQRPLPRAELLPVELIVFGIIGICLVLAMRFSPQRRRREFRATAMDYLILLLAIACAFTPLPVLSGLDAWFFLYLPTTLYACELTLVERRERPDWLTFGALAAAATMVSRVIF